MVVNCIIIEDEKPAIEILRHYISRTEFLHLQGTYADAVRSMPMINQKPIDLIFLDINLPLMSGLDFIRNSNPSAGVIITTAHPEFAVASFEQEVIDYLLKPFSYERFLKAVNRYLKLSPSAQGYASRALPADETPFLFVRTNRKMTKVYLQDIVYLEAQKNYIQIVTEHESLLSYQSISEMEERLPRDLFLRIHRSFIVAVKKITQFTSTSVFIGETRLPVGKHFSENTVRVLQGR
jgi:DNA-binding LytR/AlgR family response regulator